MASKSNDTKIDDSMKSTSDSGEAEKGEGEQDEAGEPPVTTVTPIDPPDPTVEPLGSAEGVEFDFGTGEDAAGGLTFDPSRFEPIRAVDTPPQPDADSGSSSPEPRSSGGYDADVQAALESAGVGDPLTPDDLRAALDQSTDDPYQAEFEPPVLEEIEFVESMAELAPDEVMEDG